MAVVTRGDREVSIRFDTFPARARKKLEARIGALTAQLEARVRAAAPHRTGALRSEITERDFADSPSRIAGYVSVYAPGAPTEYAKAATLEYGTSKPRRAFQRSSGIVARLVGSNKRIVARLSKPVRLAAFEYLRAPLEQMKPEIEVTLNEALAEAAAENTNG
jgi:hypothetical protein